MKVLFLTKYPYEGASSRYRVYQYIDQLEKLGVECRVSSFMSSAMYARVFSSGQRVEKLLFSVWATFRRVFMTLGAFRFDVVVFQRELLPFGGPVLERLVSALGVATVFDYDDALFVHKDSKHNEIASKLRRPEKTIEIFKIVDAVSAGNQYLADMAKPYCSNSFVVEVAEDTNRIPLRKYETDRPVVVGWLGSQSTEKYMELIKPELERLFRERPGLKMHVIGGGDFKLDSIKVKHIAWDLHTEVQELLKFDIGLMPLPMEEWSKGKSGGKARTYMAAGVVPVCTAVGYNIELIENERTGFLVTSGEEWFSTLSNLADSFSIRENVGRAARKVVEERFSIAGQANRLKEVMQKAIEIKRQKLG